MLRTRLWTAAVALPLLLTIIVYAPAIGFVWFIVAIGAWGLYEIGAMLRLEEPLPLALLIFFGGGPLAMLLSGRQIDWFGAVSVIAAMLAIIAIVAREGPDRLAGHQVLLTVAGALWVGALFPYFAWLRNLPNGVPLVILMLLLVVVSDSGAYFAGRSFGRTKLIPLVSPNKTVEGAVGGLVACVVVGVILRPLLTPALSWLDAIQLALGVGVLAQLGDLAGSAFKRAAGVKDSGWIFPGHGGLLDRTCSLVFAAVFTYYFI